MSYTIRYSEEIKVKEKRNGKAFAALGVVTVFVVCLLAFGLAMPKQLQKFREAFFPWTKPAVQEALGEFRENMCEGVSFKEAAEAFCLDLIHDAQED